MNTTSGIMKRMALNLNVRCNNRAPFLDTVTVQNGWTADGRRHMIELPNPMTKSCQLDIRATQPGCQGCRWQSTLDPRDAPS